MFLEHAISVVANLTNHGNSCPIQGRGSRSEARASFLQGFGSSQRRGLSAGLANLLLGCRIRFERIFGLCWRHHSSIVCELQQRLGPDSSRIRDKSFSLLCEYALTESASFNSLKCYEQMLVSVTDKLKSALVVRDIHGTIVYQP